MVGETGAVAPPGDPRRLAAAILELIREAPDRREARRTAARARVVDLYTLDMMVSRYHRLYYDLIAGIRPTMSWRAAAARSE
jgi:glycosyltransferase involved in cell wall biosynthesis